MNKKRRIRYLLFLIFMMVVSSCTLFPTSNEAESPVSESPSSEIYSSENESMEDPTSEAVSEPELSSSEISSSEESSISVELELARGTYTNPVYNNDFPDPSGVYDPIQRMWFLYATHGQYLRSTDGVTWTKLSYVFSHLPQWGTPGAGLWAPDVQYINGQYVLYYSLSTWGDPNPGIGYATAPKPQGPWTDHGKLFLSQEIGVNNSIDANAFVDPNTNRVYLVWGSMRGNYMVELKRDGLSFRAGSVEQAAPTKVRVAGLDTSTGWEVDTYEGAYIRYWNGYYYLFLSTGTCCEGLSSTYKVVVGRATTPFGPYYDHENRLMTNKAAGKLVVQKNDTFVGTGHNSVIDDVNGEPWFYYHAYHVDNAHRRILLMEKILFDEKGWPYVQGLQPSTTEQTGPYYHRVVQ
ncbi:MAG: family 43 glycosylhydrolase [Bacilli bacterium]|jgi:arabinan endo-1,5-alpha-L-arabinosidase